MKTIFYSSLKARAQESSLKTL